MFFACYRLADSGTKKKSPYREGARSVVNRELLVKKTTRYFATVPLAQVLRKMGAKANPDDAEVPMLQSGPAAAPKKRAKAGKRAR